MPAIPRREPFGILPNGSSVDRYTLTNATGTTVSIMTRGAAVLSISTLDRDGRFGDVVLGFDTLEGYLDQSFYCGAVVGRYANRIGRGRFPLDGVTRQLTVNDGRNHLHGGLVGFDKVVWRATPFAAKTGMGVSLTHLSPDGEEGYPGTLTAEVRYRLTDADELVVDYRATTDAPTPVNLTQHTYFNLAGPDRDILGHSLTVAADRYLPIDEASIPTGEIESVVDTPFDFRKPTTIGARIAEDHTQLTTAKGYDHTLIASGKLTGLRPVASVLEPTTGRTLDVETTEPGIHLYSGNFLDGKTSGKGRIHRSRSGFCLETHHFPDSPNHPRFPNTILRPGEAFGSRTVFRFGVLRRE